MDILRDARAFAFDAALPFGNFNLAAVALARDKQRRQPNKCDGAENGKNAEPKCLVKKRKRSEGEPSGYWIPHAVAVTGHHAKGVIARRNLSIGDCAFCGWADPFL